MEKATSRMTDLLSISFNSIKNILKDIEFMIRSTIWIFVGECISPSGRDPKVGSENFCFGSEIE
jgi:hypothetical protein